MSIMDIKLHLSSLDEGNMGQVTPIIKADMEIGVWGELGRAQIWLKICKLAVTQ